MSLRVAPILLVAIAACAAETGRAGSSQAALVDAAPVEEHSFSGVLALTSEDFGGYTCTTSLLNPRVAVAALHCICRDDGTMLDAASLGIAVGANAMRAREVARVEELRIPQGVRCGAPWDRKDLLVLVLDRPLHGVEVYLPELNPAAVRMGTPTTHVGYGTQQAGLEPGSVPTELIGEKRWRTSSVSDHNIAELTVGGAEAVGCYGDSGGPVFDEEGRILGVASRVAGFCQGYTTYIRLSYHEALVRQAFADTYPSDLGWLEAEEPEATPNAGGCAAGGRHGAPLAPLALLLGLGALRRRR